MDNDCNQNCSTCSEECDERKTKKSDLIEKPHELSNIKKVIGVVSGKGGVGKSLITSMLAVLTKRQGFNTAILDADITGPSIPKTFGLTQKAEGSELGLFPVKSRTGIDIMSINLLLENDTNPVVWRGPLIAGTVKQFWTDVIWGDIDYMFIDMPPGTGDVPLTVFQSLNIDGIIVVTSPQELVSMIVSKAVKMAEMMEVPILGIVENMSYVKCPDCEKEIKVFGESNIEKIAKEHNISLYAQLPIDPKIATACDKGMIELFDGTWLDNMVKVLTEDEKETGLENDKKLGGEKLKIAVASEGGKVTEHFGHCESFNIFHIEDKKIIKSELVSNPGHKPGFLPNYLNDLGVNIIISGGMGTGAVDIFNEKGIKVIIGARGDAETVVKDYLKGELKLSGNVCEH